VLPPDVLLVASRHIPEIDKVRQQVRPDGKINLPLLGEVVAAGKTPGEIEEQINALALQYYAEVDANVQVVAYNSQKYFIFGQVHQAGSFPWTGHDTLLDALATAQPNFLAWPERIHLVRSGSPQEGGQADHQGSLQYSLAGVHGDPQRPRPKKITINLLAMIRSGDFANNILLRPNDVIYVGPHPLAQVGLGIQSLLLPIRPAVETVRGPAGAVQTLGR
jgi:protein involved in polysaccharide export with SLBB domain